MTRFRGGTYSHTVDTVVFTDGTRARTDLIRLNPGVEAYSLDFSAVAPMTPSRYDVDTWQALPNLKAHAYEAEVDWILRNSFPTLCTTELSNRLRAAGHLAGAANISDHQAIAGTQAAIWLFTNGLELDTRPLHIPSRITETAEGAVFEFDGPRELGGYTVDVASSAPVTLTWQKSVDGQQWSEVGGARLTAGHGAHRKAFGVGATLAATGHGRAARGYRYYRLSVQARGDYKIGDVGFWLQGSGSYRNANRIVALYNYLLDGARRARARTVAPRLETARATVCADLIGPIRLHATQPAALTVTPACSAVLVDADGAGLAGAIEPGRDFYLRTTARTVTLTVTVPGTPDGHGGRVLTGVAREEASCRYTPLALVVPAQLVVDFEVSV